MADLREQLLRAGLIDKQAKQQADTSDRRNRKRKKKKKRTAPSEEERRRQEFEARLAAEAEENRRREEARRQERETQERRHRVADLIGAWAVRETKPGPRRFCFVGRERRIQWLDVSAELAWKLELGQVAIVDHPGDEDEPYALVPRRIAERIHGLDPEAVRFWNREPPPDEPSA